MPLKGKTVVVTGASRGIGRAIALLYRARGARVIGTRTGAPADADDHCDEYLAGDFADGEQLRACAAAVRELAPDILVNNAGINKIAPFAEVALEDFQRIQQVNVVAPFLLCQAALPGMIARGWGRIVNLSSIWGKVGKEHRAAYSASKFGVDGLTLALALEHGAAGILANCVAPGFTDTELTRRVLGEEGIAKLTSIVPVRRMAGVDEIAELVVWLGGTENTYVTGQNIAIDGGFTRA